MVLKRSLFCLTFFILLLTFIAGCSGGSSGGDTPTPSSVSYKGLWAPAIMVSGVQSMDDTTTLSTDGFNIVCIGAIITVDDDSNLAVLTSTTDVGSKIDEYQAAGFSINLALLLAYSSDGTIENLEPAVDLSTTSVDIDTMLTSFQSVVSDFAALAEAQGVEIFTPYNEPDLALGASTASTWGQSILPVIASGGYTGNIMYKTGLDYGETAMALDLTGYDIVGISLSPTDAEREALDTEYAERVENAIVNLKAAASTYDIEKAVISEFGVWGVTVADWNATEIAQAYEIVFVKGSASSLDGYFAFDGPSITSDPSLKDTAAEAVVAEYFNDLL